MLKKEYAFLTQFLLEAVTFLTKVIPKRSVLTWVELLFGAMLTQTGFVTDAYLVIDACRHWTSYYKWLQHGKWSWTALGLQTARFAIGRTASKYLYAAIDDTLVLRSSRKAPESRVHHQHGKKANRPTFILGQNWVSLAIIVSAGWRSVAVPVLSRLPRSTGNGGKLTAANTLLRVFKPLVDGLNFILLLDSWYMRRKVIFPVLEKNGAVIGQVRKDTALFLPPEPSLKKRGRPRKYGLKMTQTVVDQLPVGYQRLFIYGAWHRVEYRSCLALARFLNGRTIRAVWVRMAKDDGPFQKQRLILSTDLSISPVRVILAYAKRWTIEDMFNQVKNRWGMNQTWQQTRQVLHRWVQILSTSFALVQLLAIQAGKEGIDLVSFSPWRKNHPITAGRIRSVLDRIFRHFNIRSLWNPKSQKFESVKCDVQLE